MNNGLPYIDSISEANVNFDKDFLVLDWGLRGGHVNPSLPGDLRALLEALVRVVGGVLDDLTNVAVFVALDLTNVAVFVAIGLTNVAVFVAIGLTNVGVFVAIGLAKVQFIVESRDLANRGGLQGGLESMEMASAKPGPAWGESQSGDGQDMLE